MLTPNTCSRPIKHSISISSSPIVDAEARIRGIRREPTGKAQQMMKDGLWIGWNLDCAAHKGDYIWAVLLPINWPTRRCAEVGGDCVTEANRQPFLDVTPSSFITLCLFFFCLGDMGKEEERQSKHFQTMWKKRKRLDVSLQSVVIVVAIVCACFVLAQTFLSTESNQRRKFLCLPIGDANKKKKSV